MEGDAAFGRSPHLSRVFRDIQPPTDSEYGAGGILAILY
jgi:hypothetical protein